MAASHASFTPAAIASRRAAVPAPAQIAPPGPQPNASMLTSVVARPSTAAVAKKRKAVRAPLHHSRAVFTYSMTEQPTPPSPVTTTSAASALSRRGEASQAGRARRRAPPHHGPPPTGGPEGRAPPPHAPHPRAA